MSTRLATPVILAALCLASATVGYARPGPDINAQSFELAPAQGDGLMVRSATPQGELDWSLRAVTVYQRDSLVFSAESDAGLLTQRVHGQLWSMQLAAAMGWGKWTFAAALPVALRIDSVGPDVIGYSRPLAPLFGDLRLEGRRHLLRRDLGASGVVDLAAGVLWATPTGAAGSWLSDGGARLDLMGIGSWRRGVWEADASVALRLRPLTSAQIEVPSEAPNEAPTRVDALSVGSEWVLQVAAGRRWLHGQLGGRIALQVRGAMSGEATADQTLVEAMLQGDWALNRGAWKLWAAVGGGLTQAYGSSQVRLVGGAQFDPESVARDSDGDGLDDRDDRCPKAAEDKDGFEDTDGCPEPDNDGDGVLDTVDQCPLRAEDRDGTDDEDGCPDLDDDGDGVPDQRDRCPKKAEDVDGFEDSDGCPEPDNDGDGVPDADDFCPNAAETFNKYQDADGCPDTPPRGVFFDPDRGNMLSVPGRIDFEPGTLELTPSARRLLGEVARYLNKTKVISAIEVQVHTDNNGKRRALKKLSVERARVVMRVLAQLSRLETHHIKAVGKGRAAPIASNDTLDGRSRNRRVEIRVLAVKAEPKKKPAPAAKDKAKQAAPKATTGGGAKKPASEPTPSSKPSATPSSKPSAKPSAAAKPSSR